MRLCGYGCGRVAKYPPAKGRLKWCCCKSPNSCPNMKKINSNLNIGKIRNKGIPFSDDHKQKIGLSQK